MCAFSPRRDLFVTPIMREQYAMKVGFSVVCRNTQVEFQLCGAEKAMGESLLTWCQTSHYVAVLMGRLYYRHELLAAIAPPLLPRSPDGAVSDAALALAAYCQFGPHGLTRLEGDFAAVLWDARAETLTGVRDPMGGYPLFWTAGAGAIALSTSVYPLLPLLPHRALNYDYIAEYLMLPGQMQELPSEQCVYAGISRFLPGTIITVHVPTRRVHQHQYWRWLERVVEPDTARHEELSERYAHLVRHAVRERLGGRTTSHLSGGMDSTAVALIAHDWMRAGVGQAPLHTLSLVYDQLSGLTEETPYLDSVLAECRGIVPHRIPADDLLDFDSFAAPPPHDEPYIGLRRLPLDRATIDAAAQCGAATMLTGLGADEMTVASPFHLTDLLRRHHLRAAWAEACRWARIDNCSPWHLLSLYGVTNILPVWMRGGVHAWLRRGSAAWDRQNKWTLAPWITPDFARQYALRDRAIAQARQTFGACQPTGLSFALSLLRSRMGDVNRWALAAPHNLAVAHPFLDPRVLCFSLGIHATRRPDPSGQKPLLAHAMRHVLPAPIRQRRHKADFSVIYYSGLARNLRQLEAMIHQAPLDALAFLHKETLLRCLQQAALGAANGVDGTHKLNLTLALLKWWGRQNAWQRAALPPARVIHTDCSDGMRADPGQRGRQNALCTTRQ